MSLYDKQSSTANGGWDGDFFVDPSYKQKMTQQPQQITHQSHAPFQEGVGIGQGMPHAQSAPNLYGQGLQQGWQMQQQSMGMMGQGVGGYQSSRLNPQQQQSQQFF
eukprot:TRINITY_DN3007_c0_g2_i6.p2 TRINITY_DN3007_c0_g2~~TRINITY_DN3007_c0_g2_i6.p2  ORF type:complete len:106 (-),score=15.69 TRINITY_DN3007_c0_g2_i6:546-863(-)